MNSNLINQAGYAKTLDEPIGSMIFAGSKFMLADFGNNRVLIYNSFPSQNNAAADVVIGQQDMLSVSANQGGAPAANTLSGPVGICSNGTNLIIADWNNHRVLVYNTIPASNNASADVVIGQADMSQNSPNQGGSCAANTLFYPYDVALYGSKLIISDFSNNRVLIYNSVPAMNGANADTVIGQEDMDNRGAGTAANKLQAPNGLHVFGDKLFVCDYSNSRVLIYNSVPSANNASADIVIGQANMVSGSANRGGAVTANTLNYPSGVYIHEGKLIIADYRNSRTLIYNSIPSTYDASADIVIGQPDMTSNSINQGGSCSASTLYWPISALVYNSKLVISDRMNHRVLVYNSIPSSNNAPADFVIGQPDMTHNQINQSDIHTANTLYSPHGGVINGNRLFIADYFNNRVLIYNSIPASANANADVVIGQPDMVSNSANQGRAMPEANTLYYPIDVFTDGTKLIISDAGNYRVLIFNTIPVSNNASADVVIGQSDMTSRAKNQGGSPSASAHSYCYGLFYDGNKLFIADTENNRVLIYNSLPAVNNAAADVVVGQPDMTSSTANNGGVSARSLYYLSGVLSSGGKLFITDRNNHRVLVFSNIPTANNASADVVIGQTDMTSHSLNQGGSAASNTLNAPRALRINNGRLFVVDTENHRLLVYNTVPISNNMSANMVIGQSDMSSNSANQGGDPSSKTLNFPVGVDCDSTILFIADASNNRVLIYDLNTTKPVISDVKINEAGVVSGDTINSIPTLKAKLSGSGTVGGVYINNLKITLGSTLYTYASFDASTDSYNSTTGIFTFKVKNELVPGKYDLKIEVSDYLGNWATYEATDLEVRAGSEAEIIGVPLNYPNPFNTTAGTTKITYNLTVDSNILVYIFDVRGALVWKRSYLTGSMGGKAGYNEVEWDGKDDFGSTVGNGIYPFRIVAGAKVLGRGKIAVLD